MEGKIIYCFGGAGSIGSELVRQLAPKNTVIVIDNNETALFDIVEELTQKGFNVKGHLGDVRNEQMINEVARKFGYPTVIFNCAALKHVTPSAWNPLEYVTTNIVGTLNILRYAELIGGFYKGTKVINISTDKVVNANSIMGATKKVAEIAVKNAGHVSVRFGNVIGSRGSVLPIWQRQLDNGEPLTVTDKKMTRFMMTIPQACTLLIKAAEVGEPGQILIMDMGEPVNVLKLAKDILKKADKDNGIKMIGVRPGETLFERLMTDEEEARAEKVGEFYVI